MAHPFAWWLSLTLSVALSAGTAVAGGRDHSLAAKALRVTTSLGGETRIRPDARLSGTVRYDFDGADDCVTAAGTDTVVLSARACDDGTLSIAVPANMPVTLTQDGDGKSVLGNLGGALVATVAGSGDLNAGRVADLKLTLRSSGDAKVEAVRGAALVEVDGSGDAVIGSLDGGLHSRQDGSGNLLVGRIQAASADTDQRGSGDLLIGVGRIDVLRAQTQGSGDMYVAAVAGTADLRAGGSGTIKLVRATGAVTRDTTGEGKITVGGSALEGVVADKIAAALSGADLAGDGGAGGGTALRIRHSPGAGHFVAILAALAVLFLVWRMVRRNGGWAPIRARLQGRVPPPPPVHHGVASVVERVGRVEARLGLVEAYVTSREFDLQQKFRDLGRTSPGA